MFWYVVLAHPYKFYLGGKHEMAKVCYLQDVKLFLKTTVHTLSEQKLNVPLNLTFKKLLSLLTVT